MTTALSESLQKAVRLHQTGDVGSAEKIYRQILRVDPAHADALHYLGIVQHQQNRNIAALDYIGQAIDVNATSAPYWNSLGSVHRSLGQQQKALRAIQRAIQIAPHFGKAYLNLGQVLAELNENPGAEACFRKAIELDSSDLDARLHLAALLLDLGNINQALEEMRTALSSATGAATHFCSMASRLEQQREFDQALAVYGIVFEIEPDSAAACLGMAHVLLSQRRLEKSRDWYEKGLALDPTDAAAWTNLGCIRGELGDTAGAIEDFQRAIESDDAHIPALYNLGNALAKQGEHQRAIDSYRRVTALQPDHTATLKNLGNAFIAVGQHADAENCYRRVIALQPEDVGAHLNLGQVLKQQQKFDEAEAEYRKVLEAQPENGPVHFVLGRTLELAGRMDVALEHYRRASELEPENALAHFYFANALKSQGKFPEAIASYQRARELKPDHAPTIYQLGNAYRHLKRYDEARNCYVEVLRQRPSDFETMISLGNVLKSQDDLAGARVQYRKVLEQLPEQPLWRLWTATLCPIVFHSTYGIDEFRERLGRELKILARKNLQIAPEDITQCGCPPPYVLQFHGRNDRPLKEAYAHVFQNCLKPERMTRRAGKPRIGFVVTEGHEGVFLRFLGRVVESLNSDLFEIAIVCSAGGSERIRRDFHSDTVELLVVPSRFDRIVDALREARFDLLYHWEVGSDVTNYFLPFFKLAPVQCTGAGVAVTSGISQVDYYISDGLAEPDRGERHYTETLVRCSSIMTCQQRLMLPERPKSREDFGFSNDQHLYVCPHKIEKFHPELDSLFREILQRDPRGLVVIPKDREGYVARKLENRLALTTAGVAERIRFVPYQTLDGYLSLLEIADVLLDPLHYGGGLTSLDGFSLNQPIVTFPGEFLRSRFTYGFYRRMEFMDCVAASVEDYVNIAVRIGKDAEYRHDIRQRLSERTNVLFDDADSVHEYEQRFLTWIDHARKAS